MTKKPKADAVAYGIAKRAAALHMKKAAKLRFEAQSREAEGWPVNTRALDLADQAEALARVWLAKARIALDPEGHAIKQMHEESGLDAAGIEWAKIETENQKRERRRLRKEAGLAPDDLDDDDEPVDPDELSRADFMDLPVVFDRHHEDESEL